MARVYQYAIDQGWIPSTFLDDQQHSEPEIDEEDHGESVSSFDTDTSPNYEPRRQCMSTCMLFLYLLTREIFVACRFLHI